MPDYLLICLKTLIVDVFFQVTDWDKEQYGEFYSGDSYIILNTYKPEGMEEIKYDLHFWIGKYSTQDEYGKSFFIHFNLSISKYMVHI